VPQTWPKPLFRFFSDAHHGNRRVRASHLFADRLGSSRRIGHTVIAVLSGFIPKSGAVPAMMAVAAAGYMIIRSALVTRA
jgi:hypothetical protein